MKKIITLAIAFLLFIPFASINGSNISSVNNINGDILYVGGNGPNNYTSIQAAINDAENGYTIYVYPKQYNESIVINKSISLIGIVENRNKPIIDGRENESAVLILADGCMLKKFKVMYGKGIALRNCRNCVIEDNTISYSEGNSLSVYKSFNNLIKNNSILKNDNEGIHISHSSYNVITNNLVAYNKWTGIVVFWNSTNDIISYNNVTGNLHGMEIGDAASNRTVSFNHVYKNKQYGICVTGRNVSVLNNTIHDHAYGGLQLMDCSYCIVSGNEIYYNEAGIMVQSNYMWEKQYNLIKRNKIYSNYFGIYIEDSLINTFTENNLINNKYNAWFWEQTIIGYPSPLRPCYNIWNKNYWEDWYLPIPKPINGLLTIWWKSFYIDLPWFVFDRHPAMEPYKI